MGAVASVETKKPTDASDILNTKSLDFAKSEIVRLRKDLGHLAHLYGMDVVCLDASDLVLGDNADEDFMRCVREISHIRRCLQLNTQTSIRNARRRYAKPIEEIQMEEEGKEADQDSDSDSDS